MAPVPSGVMFHLRALTMSICEGAEGQRPFQHRDLSPELKDGETPRNYNENFERI